jgi:hypothetical protein
MAISLAEVGLHVWGKVGTYARPEILIWIRRKGTS